MKTPILSLLAALVVSFSAAAADTDTTTPKPEPKKDAVIESARGAIELKDWARAQAVLQEGVIRNPGNADYHNLYAYSIRKSASPNMNLVFKHYNEALRINPEHRGAHEYIGEAYLMVGNLPKAKEHLGALDRLCFLPCAEYSDLKTAVAEFETRRSAAAR
jgi:tetratricopeptide (TPR) repeat protein